jgi:hypothetical protein
LMSYCIDVLHFEDQLETPLPIGWKVLSGYPSDIQISFTNSISEGVASSYVEGYLF